MGVTARMPLGWSLGSHQGLLGWAGGRGLGGSVVVMGKGWGGVMGGQVKTGKLPHIYMGQANQGSLPQVYVGQLTFYIGLPRGGVPRS